MTAPSSTPLTVVSILPGATNPNSVGYSPQTIVVVIGSNNTVEWMNNDIVQHTVVATNGNFNSGGLTVGSAWSYTFTLPGVYTYTDPSYPWMKGTVIVIGA